MKPKDLLFLLKETVSEWSEDKAPRLAAALSYYTVFSIAPILVIAIAVAGLVFGQEAAQNQIVGQIGGLVGQEAAQEIQTMIAGASRGSGSVIATIIGIVTLLFGAAGVFGQLQDAMNTMWEVAPKPNRGILALIKDRFFSFTMVMGVAFMLLVSLVVSAALTAFNEWTAGLFPGLEVILQVVNFVVSFGIITLLFALIFKIVPDADVAWRDTWLGAAVTALLFVIGRALIGIYMEQGDFSSTYGPAASLIVILLWVYYSSQILFFGAEFTQVYANKFGSRVVPEPHAMAITEEARAQQGIPRRGAVAAAAAGSPAADRTGASAVPVTGVPAGAGAPVAAGPLASHPTEARPREPELLPQPEPSLLAIFSVAASLVGFLGGWALKASSRPKAAAPKRAKLKPAKLKPAPRTAKAPRKAIAKAKAKMAKPGAAAERLISRIRKWLRR